MSTRDEEEDTKKQKGKGKKKKQNDMIISLLEQNAQQLSEMKNRINFLESNNRNVHESQQLVISTPLIDKHFPSQQPANSNDRKNDSFYQQSYNGITPSVPSCSYYVQHPYYNNWVVPHQQALTPQGATINQQPGPVLMQPQQVNPYEMSFKRANQESNFFDYAMLEYFKSRH